MGARGPKPGFMREGKGGAKIATDNYAVFPPLDIEASMPEWLSPAEQKEWRRFGQLLTAAGVLHAGHAPMFAMMMSRYCQYQRMARELGKEREVTSEKYWKLSKMQTENWADLMRVFAKFGLYPDRPDGHSSPGTPASKPQPATGIGSFLSKA